MEHTRRTLTFFSNSASSFCIFSSYIFGKTTDFHSLLSSPSIFESDSFCCSFEKWTKKLFSCLKCVFPPFLYLINVQGAQWTLALYIMRHVVSKTNIEWVIQNMLLFYDILISVQDDYKVLSLIRFGSSRVIPAASLLCPVQVISHAKL